MGITAATLAIEANYVLVFALVGSVTITSAARHPSRNRDELCRLRGTDERNATCVAHARCMLEFYNVLSHANLAQLHGRRPHEVHWL